MTDLRRYRQDQPDAGSTEAGQALLPVRDIVVKGIAITDMLNDMELPAEPWEQAALTLTRRQAAFYPDYMKQAASKPISRMIAGYKNARIASIPGYPNAQSTISADSFTKIST